MRRLTALIAAAAVLLPGCSFTSVWDVPLPGGADVGDNPYRVHAQFASVLDLVPQAAVRVNDVAVGRVEKITLPKDSWTANVTMLVNRKVKLPANASAYLEQSSLLGEKYVQLVAPKQGAYGSFADGATIPAARTNRNPEVEEVFGALSLLLNGGGLPQLRTITRELNNALSGNEPQIKSLLRRLNELMSTLNSRRDDITAAIDGLHRLSSTVAVRKKKVETALDDLPDGLKVLESQRGALVTMLRRLDSLSGVATNVVRKSKDDLVADLRALAPTLRKLADSGRDLPKSLEVLLTYPFTDQVMKGAIKGDYMNVYLEVAAAPGSDCVIPPVTPDPTPPSQRLFKIGPQPTPDCKDPTAPPTPLPGGRS